MTSNLSFALRGQVFSIGPAEPGLYVVSTPIGNLGDMTIRGLEVLAGCTVIACEDTRTSGVLLKRYGIDRPKVSYNEHNASTRGPDLLRQIEQGAAVALISDAGTPLVSDPGTRLVKEAIDMGLRVFPIPGASAPLAALVGSGLCDGAFRFGGFLPSKAKAREDVLKKYQDEEDTLVFFESPARASNSLEAMAALYGEQRPATVARELTKMHETFHRGTLAELSEEFSAMEKVRGEIVIVVQGAEAVVHSDDDVDGLLLKALKTMKTKQAANSVAELTGLSKQHLYQRALSLRDD